MEFTSYLPHLQLLVKAALINIFRLTIYQMTMCDVKGVFCSNKTTEIYHLTLQEPLLLLFLGSFTSLFWCMAHNFTVLV